MKISTTGVYTLDVLKVAGHLEPYDILDALLCGHESVTGLRDSSRIGSWILKFSGVISLNYRPSEGEDFRVYDRTTSFKVRRVSSLLRRTNCPSAEMSIEQHTFFTGGLRSRSSDRIDLLLDGSEKFIREEILPRLAWHGFVFNGLSFDACSADVGVPVGGKHFHSIIFSEYKIPKEAVEALQAGGSRMNPLEY